MGILTRNPKGLVARFAAIAGFCSRSKRTTDTVLVQDCLLCGQPDSPAILCRNCADDLPRLPANRCPVCALPTLNGEHCGRCLAHPPHYDRTLAVFQYEFPLDKLIQSFKYGHRLSLSAYFGRELLDAAQPVAAGLNLDMIVPLPLHRARLRERGFNQALELARPVAAGLGLPLESSTCTRIRATPAQATLPWKERERNIRGAFACQRDLTNRRVLLIDDVMTTGASLDECARTLKLHGAAEVTLLIVARTLP